MLEMPYATFTYEVEKIDIVDPTEIGVVRNVDYERLVLSACHPLYTAAQRIVAFGRLKQISLPRVGGVVKGPRRGPRVPSTTGVASGDALILHGHLRDEEAKAAFGGRRGCDSSFRSAASNEIHVLPARIRRSWTV